MYETGREMSLLPIGERVATKATDVAMSGGTSAFHTSIVAAPVLGPLPKVPPGTNIEDVLDRLDVGSDTYAILDVVGGAHRVQPVAEAFSGSGMIPFGFKPGDPIKLTEFASGVVAFKSPHAVIRNDTGPVGSPVAFERVFE